jgi:hypothetical protein
VAKEGKHHQYSVRWEDQSTGTYSSRALSNKPPNAPGAPGTALPAAAEVATPTLALPEVPTTAETEPIEGDLYEPDPRIAAFDR